MTSARHDIFHNKLALDFPESFDSSIDKKFVYSGSKSLFDKLNDITLGASFITYTNLCPCCERKYLIFVNIMV